MKKISLLFAFLATQITFCPGNLEKESLESKNLIERVLLNQNRAISKSLYDALVRTRRIQPDEVFITTEIHLSTPRAYSVSILFDMTHLNRPDYPIIINYTEPIEPFNHLTRNQ